MSILPKFIYKFNAIQSKSQQTVFWVGVEIDKLILKLYENAPKLLLCYSNPDSTVVS